MANLAKVEDETLRGRLEEANQQLRKGKPTDAVHTLAEVFTSMLNDNAGARGATVPGRRGRRSPLAMAWPNLGANLSPQSVRDGKPEIVFTRDRFALSEAITYYEFTVEAAIALQSAGTDDETEEQNA